MAKLTTRSLATDGSTVSANSFAKGSALTISEMDSNFLNLNNDKLENTTDTFTGTLSIQGSSGSAVGGINLAETTNNGSHTITLKAPDSVTSSYNFTLPVADGTANQVITTNGSGQLAFQSIAGDIQSIAITAGTGLTGSVTTASGDHTQTLAIDSTVATLTGSQTLTNKTLTTPVIASISNTGTVTLPTSTDTLVGRATTDTLTNKSIDADNNTITNLEVDNLKSGVLDTDISSVAGTDTTLASAKAIKTYVDAQIATKDNTDEITEGSSNFYFTDARARAVSIENVVEDTTPQLGGSLDVNGNKIVSTSNGDIDIEPNGTGDVLLGNFKFDADQSVGSGQDNYVLKYDHSSGKISLEADATTTSSNQSQSGANFVLSSASNLDTNNNKIINSTSSGSIGVALENDVVRVGETTAKITTPSAIDLVLDTNLGTNSGTFTITDGANGNMTLAPNGTGDVVLGNFTFDADQTVGASQDNFVLTYDNSSGKISLEAASGGGSGISNVVEDTSPELGGDLDVLARKITSSSANVVISADATDKEVHIKVDDAGGTSQTAAEFRDFAFTENATAGSSGTAATVYNTIADLHKGIRIGSTSNNFSSTGAAGNNNNGAYNTSGILIGNKGNTWPVVDIISNGQAEGENPLYNRFGSSGLLNFPNGQFNFKASNGTAASPSALESGKRMGQINFYGHDGTGYGGSSDAAPSATITATANETFSGDTRGGKLLIDVLPSGQSGGTGTTSSDRIAGLSLTGSELVLNPDSKNLDIKVNGDTNTDIFKIDAGFEETTIGGGGLIIKDDTKQFFGNDGDAFVRWRDSNSELEANIYGNLDILVSDAGASGKGNVRVRADTKVEIEAGKDRDSKGDLLLTSFDDFQFRKLGYASTDTTVSPTTNGTTSVTLSRSLDQGEQNALNDEALFFFDGDPTSSSTSGGLRDMSRYRFVTGVSGSGSSTVITLEDAVSNLSNATHSAEFYLHISNKSTAVLVDGTRGRLEDKFFIIQNRMGFEGPVGMGLKFEAIEFHDGFEYKGSGTGQSDEAEESPVTYELFTEANKNNFTLEHSTKTAGTRTTKDIYEVRGRSSTASTVASKTTPDMIRFNVDVDAEKNIVLHNQSGDPSGVSNASHIYAKDESSSSEVFVRDEAGNVTKISPHNEQGEWEYYSRNIKTGKTVRVNMEKMIQDIERLTGNKYIENE